MNDSTSGRVTLRPAQAAALRSALFAELAAESIKTGRDLEDADHEQRAREIGATHHRAVALGALLDAIGWTPQDPGEQAAIDLRAHAWAALAALPPYATLNRETEREHTHLGHPARAQAAAARAKTAEDALQAVEQAIAAAGINPAPPPPAP